MKHQTHETSNPRSTNLDGGDKLRRHGLPVSSDARGDVPGNTHELQLPAPVVHAVHAGLRREAPGRRGGVGGDGNQLRLGEVSRGGGDSAKGGDFLGPAPEEEGGEGRRRVGEGRGREGTARVGEVRARREGEMESDGSHWARVVQERKKRRAGVTYEPISVNYYRLYFSH